MGGQAKKIELTLAGKPRKSDPWLAPPFAQPFAFVHTKFVGIGGREDLL